MFGFAAEGTEVDGLYVTRVADVEDIFSSWFIFGGSFCGGWGSIGWSESVGL